MVSQVPGTGRQRDVEITVDVYPCHDWSRLIGTPVEIRKDFSIVRAGIVDDAMPDSSALWLAADSTYGRELFAAADGYQVWIRPQELGGKLCYKMAAAHLAPSTTDTLRGGAGLLIREDRLNAGGRQGVRSCFTVDTRA